MSRKTGRNKPACLLTNSSIDSIASRLLNKGMRMDIIQRLLGHASIQTTERYAHTEFSPNLRAQLDTML